MSNSGSQTIKLVTQFDPAEARAVVATPTCGGCCCCCCCAASTLGTGTLTSIQVQSLGRRQKVSKKRLIGATLLAVIAPLAAVALPIVVFIKGISEWLMMSMVAAIAVSAVLFYVAFKLINANKVADKVTVSTGILAIAFTIELFIGAYLVIVDYVLYLIFVIFVVLSALGLGRWLYGPKRR